MKNANFYLLGIAVSYLVMGINQLTSNNLFTGKIYLVVSFVTIAIAIVELAKIVYTYLQEVNALTEKSLDKIEKINKKYYSINERVDNDMSVFSSFLNTEVNRFKIDMQKIKKLNSILRNSVLITEGVSIIATMFILITFPYKNIVDSLQNNILISGLSLVAFSLMFGTLFLNDYFGKDLIERKNKGEVNLLKIENYLCNELYQNNLGFEKKDFDD
ncbi:hypothetical protein [Anaerorhabdus sp.]|uniref:hypothetical protein n=1 Tax=Anaerorhabdus sp. TaxID=1872524 RepID=UPI002FCA9EC7